MMMSPKSYVDKLANKYYEELLEKKNKLIEEINESERVEQENTSDFFMSPSPDVRYQCNLEYLAELCILISNKYRDIKMQQDLKYAIDLQ